MLAVSGAFLAPAPAVAQDPPPVSDGDKAIAENILGTDGTVVPDRVRNRCANPTRPGEIVVCAGRPDAYRIPPTSETDPNSRQATDDGRLPPPDVAGAGIFRGKPTMSGMCVIPPCPPEAAYMIDLSAIPEAPAGSDADKVARGEMRAN